MRQIVPLNPPIVRDRHAAPPVPMLCGGSASAMAWQGDATEINWLRADAVGFLLVMGGAIEVTCAAGKTSHLARGDLLVLNVVEARGVCLQLRARGNLAEGMAGASTQALHGALHAKCGDEWHHRPFAYQPAWGMAVMKLTDREFIRASTVAQLLADESSPAHGNAQGNAPSRLVENLEATLFEALSEMLWSRDPLSLPQLAAATDKRLAKAMMAIAEAPAKPWRIETMAREAAMSRTVFAVRFKKIIGKTPLDFLTSLRLQYALTLLHAPGTASLDAIAKEVGLRR